MTRYILRGFYRIHVRDVHFQQFFAPVTDQTAISVVHLQEASRGIDYAETVNRILNDGAVALLALFEQRYRLLARGLARVVGEREGDVICHLFERSNEAFRKEPRFAGVKVDCADHGAALADRKLGRGAHAGAPRRLVPRRSLRVVEEVVADHVGAGKEHPPRKATPQGARAIPGDIQLIDIAGVLAVPGNRLQPLIVVVNQPDPGEAEAAVLDPHAAYA